MREIAHVIMSKQSFWLINRKNSQYPSSVFGPTLWLALCLAVHIHSHVSACPLSDSKTFFFPCSHFTGPQPAECVCKCAVRLFSWVVFMSLLVRGFTNLSHSGDCLRMQPSSGVCVCVSVCAWEGDKARHVAVISAQWWWGLEKEPH